MTTPDYLSKDWQTSQWDKVRQSAGPRYTPEVDIRLPISEIFDGLARTDYFFREIRELRQELNKKRKALKVKPDSFKKNVIERLTLVSKYAKDLNAQLLQISQDKSLHLEFERLLPKTKFVLLHIQAIQSISYAIEAEEERAYNEKQVAEGKDLKHSYRQDSKYLSSLKSLIRELRELSAVARDIAHLAQSKKAVLANNPFLIVLAEAGMGKTHLLCDITRERNENGYKTIMVLGEEMSKISSPIKSVMQARQIRGTETAFLKKLNTYGEKKRSRVLIIIDAINESDIKGWRKQLNAFRKQMVAYPWIAIAISCRTPFDNIIFSKRAKFTKEYHQGFAEYEFEAMKAYFKYYKIPLPEVPILISEFSSPLFLSSFCKTAASLRGGRGKVARSVKDIALGQVGMTKILEDFYLAKQEQIHEKYHAQYPSVVTTDWLWDKTSGKIPVIKFFAMKMADAQKESLTLNESISTISDYLEGKFDTNFCNDVLTLLVQSGVFIKDLSYDSTTSSHVEVIKFPFQKFSDHLIARYFLSSYLFSIHQPKKSFAAGQPLGELFKDERSISMRANLAEAIIVEFIERIKKNKKAHDKDIIDYLPKEVLNFHVFREIYINAMYWRRPENFLNSQGAIRKSILKYFNRYLLRYDRSTKELVDFLLTTAIKPKHPLNHLAFSNWLEKMQMASRDVFWSEYLRNSYQADPTNKLITWIEEHDVGKIPKEHAEAIIETAAWFLTTTSHRLRRRATRCLFLVGVSNPSTIFNVSIKALKYNDPYIHEMMLAAAYGVAMHYKNEKELAVELTNFSKEIFKLFFDKRASASTTHIYTRDYARGIVELALHSKLLTLSKNQLKHLRPPYTRGGIRAWGNSTDKDEGQYRDGNAPIGMDFENYTLGRLVEDRSNYDFSHPQWKKVKSNVLWRIYKLGYTLEKFGSIDKRIASDNHRVNNSAHPDQVDRYGKKYSWIAYYELFGYRVDKSLVKSYFSGNSYRESEDSLDPSFPLMAKVKYPVSTNLLRGPREMAKWLRSAENPNIEPYLNVKFENSDDDWILIDGTLGQLKESTAKRNRVWFSGVFVSESHKQELKEYLEKTPHWGNVIPEAPERRFEYAGELGWHPDYSDSEGKRHLNIVVGHKRVKLPFRPTLFQLLRVGATTVEETTEPRYIEQPIYKKIPVRRISRYFATKDYANIKTDDGLGIYIPSNAMINALKLRKEKGTFNFLDSKGELATISTVDGGPCKTHRNFLYLRKDLFQRLLKIHKAAFLMCAHGERQYWPKNMSIGRREDLSPIYQGDENIHKQIKEIRVES
jgi:hypothetical protein